MIHSSRASLGALVISVALGLSTQASAQCTPHWLAGGGLPGADVYVAASTTWDPDGPGPEPELLVIAGDFQVIGHQPLRGLAGWDGWTWREIDPNSGGDIYSIRALAVYHGELIAAGSFSTLGGVAMNNIARFDGHAWHPLGLGPDNGITGTAGFANVNVLRVVGDRVIVGGLFDLAGGVSAINIAAWDGNSSTWSALGDGLAAGLFYEGVYSLAEHGGELVAAGDFTLSGATSLSGVAHFDGTSWIDYAPVNSFFPFAVGTFQGRLVAGGVYYDFNSTDPDYFGDSVAVVWDEASSSWRRMGSSMGSPGLFGVTKFTEFDGELYASGDFADFFDYDAHGMLLRRWDGASWQPVGSDFGGFNGFQPTAATVEVHHGRLIVGGSFSHADGAGAFNLAAWDGVAWSSFATGTNGRITSMLEYADGIVASGLFDSIEGADVARLAFWNGHAWGPIGDQVIPNATPLGVFQGELVIGANGLDGSVRRLHGNSWLPFGEGIPNAYVRCMAKYQGNLIVGGNFSFTGFYGETIDNVARWDGQHWRALGAGVSGQAWGLPAAAMTVFKGKLIVAGGLDTAGGQPANAIASWNGNTWQSLGQGLTTPPGQVIVWDLALYKGQLVATGQFQHAGSVAARNIARWDGEHWFALGPGGDATLTGWGRALATIGNDLYVGGQFWGAGGLEAHNIARWDGVQWSAMQGGVDPHSFGSVDALAKLQGQLFVGGTFVQTGAGISAFLARWGCD